MHIKSNNAFGARVEQVIQKNLSDPHFSLGALMREMKMGRSIFFLRFRLVFGTSPTDYIRALRLQKGAYLLQHSSMSISEVASRVGFRSLAYFTKCFTNHYGVSPSTFQARKVKPHK
ncbi:MAG TPA: AraC family transcriptional regulator [Rhodothermales bacterium]|nr:AraC family transcriptional regulator [Rhodothermales bacterium]